MAKLIENKKTFNFKQLLLVLYLSFVIFSQIFIYLDNIFIYILSLLIILALVIPLSMLIINAQSDFELTKETKIRNQEIKNFIINFTIILTIGLIVYHAKSIAGKNQYEADFIWALQQARSNSYVEFSSPVFILFFAKLPSLIADNPVFIGTFYIFVRSIIISYVITKLSINNIVNIILILYYCFMPLSLHSEMTLMKDTPCSLCIMLTLIFAYESLSETNDKKNIKNDLLIALFATLSAFMRPNAILFSIPFILVLYKVFRYNLVRALRISGIFIVLFLTLTALLPQVISIRKSDKDWNMVETMSIPASVVMAVARYSPDALNEEEMKYLHIICGDDLEALKSFDEKQGWESVKFNKSIYNRKDLPFTYTDLAYYTFDLIIKKPAISLKQIIRSTSSLYAYRYIKYPRKNIFAGIYYLFANVEVALLFFLLISSLISKTNFIQGKYINFLLALPIIILSVVTMLIIASPSITRYYLPLQMSAPIYIINLYKKRLSA